jgi:hypothetical protein
MDGKIERRLHRHRLPIDAERNGGCTVDPEGLGRHQQRRSPGSQWFAGRLRLAQRKPTERGDQDPERYDSGQEPRRRGSSAKYRHDQQCDPDERENSQRRCVAPEERSARETATEPPIRPAHARRRYPRFPSRKTVRATAPTTTSTIVITAAARRAGEGRLVRDMGRREPTEEAPERLPYTLAP